MCAQILITLKNAIEQLCNKIDHTANVIGSHFKKKKIGKGKKNASPNENCIFAQHLLQYNIQLREVASVSWQNEFLNKFYFNLSIH